MSHAKWIKENWTVGQYAPSEDFKKIQNHSCVCRKEDRGLIAITGPADDIESQKMSDLFAAAPDLLEACRKTLGAYEQGKMESENISEILFRVIAKAEGHAP